MGNMATLHLQVPEESVHDFTGSGLISPRGAQYIILDEHPAAYKPGWVRLKVDAKRAAADGIVFTKDQDRVLTRGWAGYLPAKYVSYLNAIEPPALLLPKEKKGEKEEEEEG